MRDLMKRIGIFTLLFPMLILPMLHHHPAESHAHDGVEAQRAHAIAHADFFPNATHEYEEEDQEQERRQLDSSSHFFASSFSQIDLFSFHLAQSFQFASIFKKQVVALAQVLPEPSILLGFKRGISKHQDLAPPQTPQFPSPSLRAPPYFV